MGKYLSRLFAQDTQYPEDGKNADDYERCLAERCWLSHGARWWMRNARCPTWQGAAGRGREAAVEGQRVLIILVVKVAKIA